MSYGTSPRLTVEDDVALPRLFVISRIPPFGTEEHYVASVCAAIIGMGKGSRLYRALVRERQVCSEANAFTYDLAKGADLLIVDVLARPEITIETVEADVGRELDLIRAAGVTAEETARAIALIETGFTSAMQSAGDRADRLSMFATYFGDASLANNEVDRYRAITAERVSDFARARLGHDNRALLLYVPR